MRKLFILFCLCFFVKGVFLYANVAYDNNGLSNDCNSCNSLTFSNFVVPSGDDRLLVVEVNWVFSSSISYITYDGQTFTQAVTENDGTFFSEIWYLKLGSGPSITDDVVIILNNAAFALQGAVSTFKQVDQANPIGNTATNTGTSISPSINIPTSIGNGVIDNIILGATNTLTEGANQTLIYQQSNTGAGSFESATSASVDMSWTLTSASTFVHCGIELNEAAHQQGVISDRNGTGVSCANCSTTSISNFQVPAGKNRLLVVFPTVTSLASITNITYNGQSLTQAVSENNSGYISEIWYLQLGSGTVITSDVIINLSGTSFLLTLDAASFKNVDQGSPIGNTGVNSQTAISSTINLATTVGNMVVDNILRAITGDMTAWTNQEVLFKHANYAACSSEFATGSSVDMTWILSVTDLFAHAAVELQQAPEQAEVLYDWNGVATSCANCSTANIPGFQAPSGNDRLLVVFVNTLLASPITSILYNGQNLTPAVSNADFAFATEIWHLPLGSGGTITSDVMITLNAAVGTMTFNVATFQNVDQGNPIGNIGINGDLAMTSSINIPTATGSVVVDNIMRTTTGSRTAGANQTIIAMNGNYSASSFESTAGSSVDMSWTFNTSALFVHCAAELKYNGFLPVELTFFKGQATDNQTLLTWQTASELNNEGFIIERMTNPTGDTDDRSWIAIDFVAGSGNASGMNNYSYIDKQPILGVNYYRLKQVDYDGQFEYSKVINVTFATAISPLAIFPNPAKNYFNLFLDMDKPSGIVRLYNMEGKQVMQQEVKDNLTRLEVGYLPESIYQIEILVNDRRIIERVIINSD